MGRIGSELARRAIAFGMRVLAYDPYLAASRARAMQVELIESLDDILPRADFISMHMPLTPETRHMLDARRLGLCKPGVRIVNCARGGLIRRGRAARRSGKRAGRRGRAGRVRGRAATRRFPVARPTRKHGVHPAPGREHRRGAGIRGHRDRRRRARRVARRRDPQRRQRPEPRREDARRRRAVPGFRREAGPVPRADHVQPPHRDICPSIIPARSTRPTPGPSPAPW